MAGLLPFRFSSSKAQYISFSVDKSSYIFMERKSWLCVCFVKIDVTFLNVLMIISYDFSWDTRRGSNNKPSHTVDAHTAEVSYFLLCSISVDHSLFVLLYSVNSWIKRSLCWEPSRSILNLYYSFLLAFLGQLLIFQPIQWVYFGNWISR